MITQARLKELAEYFDGRFIRRSTRGRMTAGSIMGFPGKKGRWRCRVDNRLYQNSHLVWLWWYGVLPMRLDHFDLDKANDRIGNLREATNAQNMRNTRVRKDSQTGIKGVTVDHRTPNHFRFRAHIVAPGGERMSKFFGTIAEAAAWRREMASKLHGQFARE